MTDPVTLRGVPSRGAMLRCGAMSTSRLVAFSVAFAFGCVGCGSPETPAVSAVTDSGADSRVDSGRDTAAAPPCSDPSDDPAAQCVETVSGKALDTSGAPIAKKVVSVCGSVCYYGQTTDDGTFVAKVGNFINVANFAAYVHGRPGYVGLFEKLPLGSTRNIVLPAPMVLPVPPATGPRLPIDAATRMVKPGAVTGGDVTLTFAEGTEVELDLEDIELAAKGEELRVVKFDAKEPPAFARGQGAVLLYGAMPFDAKFKKKVGVTIASDGGLAEGTAVELFVLGSDFVKLRTAGKAMSQATGKVVGGKIQTDPGEGITLLTWIGVRAKP